MFVIRMDAGMKQEPRDWLIDLFGEGYELLEDCALVDRFEVDFRTVPDSAADAVQQCSFDYAVVSEGDSPSLVAAIIDEDVAGGDDLESFQEFLEERGVLCLRLNHRRHAKSVFDQAIMLALALGDADWDYVIQETPFEDLSALDGSGLEAYLPPRSRETVLTWLDDREDWTPLLVRPEYSLITQ